MENKRCNRCDAENTENARYCSGCGYQLPEYIEEMPLQNRQSKVQTKNKKNIAPVLGMAFGLILCIVIQQTIFKTPSFDKVMVKAASEINKTCPIMVDEDTRLDNTMAFPNNVFQYNYTLVNVEKEFLDTIEVKSLMEPRIINLVKTNPEMKYLRDNKATLSYFYRDIHGIYLFSIRINSEQYE